MSIADLRANLDVNRLPWALGAFLLALVAAILMVTPPRADARPVVAPPLIAPVRAAALVAATSGEAATEVKAIGHEARLINAAMPFASGPIASARPFALGGDSLDQNRALLCLTQAVYYEAGFEPLGGRRAVAQVVLNRMRHPAYPKSVCGVVYQRNSTPVCQFSFVCDGALYRAPAPDAWQQAREIATAALSGYVETAVGSATHYHADYVAPRWAPMLAKVVKLGAHIFYRWPGAWGMPAAFTGRYIGEPTDPAAMRPAVRRAPVIPGAPTVFPEATLAAVAGPPIARAANDVGGLLDTTKGWTLHIPLPSESGAATKAVAVEQKQTNAQAIANTEPTGPAPLIASR
ncbi:MAG: cell wall hydrolase [Pseudomonadota bacterium]|nr:cell wall hydrolase [Pseudomonadota bacterium]